MECYEYVLQNYKPHDKILMQKLPTDECGIGGHFAILRRGMVYEWYPDEGERVTPYHSYSQKAYGIDVVGGQRIFTAITINQFRQILHDSGVMRT
jgi:hypothetical protein